MASYISRQGTDTDEIQLPINPYSDLDENVSSLRSQFQLLKEFRDVPETKVSGGLCLMEVFNIVFHGRGELKPENQFGTVKVIDEYDQEYLLYSVVKECAENLPSIDNNDQLLQTGPTEQSIPGDVTFNFHVHLSGGFYKASIPCSELGYTSDFKYGGIPIESEDGSGELSILFGQFAFAVEAHVKLEFRLPSNGYADADVHGLVAARTSLLQHPMFTSTLFYTKKSHKRKVVAGKIPLFKSLVAVPTNSKLYLIIEMFINDVIVSAIVDLHPKPSGHCDTEDLPLGREEEGWIKVTVTWMGGSMGSYEQVVVNQTLNHEVAREVES